MWLLDPVTKYQAKVLWALLKIHEATDSTARCKAFSKCKGVAMWDGEEGKWRVVADLELPKSKTPCIICGNKKYWLLVCELMPGHHDNEIAAAEDKTDSRGAYIIYKAIYVGIIAACSAKTPPVIKRSSTGDCGDSGNSGGE